MIDAGHAAFIQSGVAICISTCGPEGACNLTRALGCRLVDGGRRVGVFVPAVRSAGVLADIAANGRVAAVFCQPSTNRTLQLKGSDAGLVAADAGDAAIRARQLDAFVLEVLPQGFAEASIRLMFTYPPEDVLTLAFTPSAAFSQTPGPDAGAQLGL